jgi:hypothetical protein
MAGSRIFPAFFYIKTLFYSLVEPVVSKKNSKSTNFFVDKYEVFRRLCR